MRDYECPSAGGLVPRYFPQEIPVQGLIERRHVLVKVCVSCSYDQSGLFESYFFCGPISIMNIRQVKRCEIQYFQETLVCDWLKLAITNMKLGEMVMLT